MTDQKRDGELSKYTKYNTSLFVDTIILIIYKLIHLCWAYKAEL